MGAILNRARSQRDVADAQHSPPLSHVGPKLCTLGTMGLPVDEDFSEAAVAGRVGRAVIAETEGRTRRYADLAELIDACRRSDDLGDISQREHRLGMSALAAYQVCADPGLLDRLSDAERDEALLGFAHYVSYLGSHRAAHLAPGPPTVFPEVIRRYTDGEKLAIAWWGVAMVMLESVGPEGYAPIAEAIEQQVTQLPESIVAQAEETERKITMNPALAVGRALRAEADGTRRYRNLTELINGSVALDVPAESDEETESRCFALGTAALNAAGVCLEPDSFDRAPTELRPLLLQSFAVTLNFVLEHKLWHLAPQPFDHYRGLVERYEDLGDKADVCLRAASIVRESGNVARSLEILLVLEDQPLPAPISATFHLHTGNTYRDLRRFDDAHRHYGLAEKAAKGTDEPDRSATLAEIDHQRHRLSMYSDNPEHQPDPKDSRFNPNPFRPGSILRDPEGWRAAPAQLLTLAQNAGRSGDAWTAHHALQELATAVPPTNYELHVLLHLEAAELAHRFGAPREIVRWHDCLGTCAAILSGSRRELGIVLSHQAARMAAYTDAMPAITLARWAAAADRVSLYTAGIQADIGYVLYRNGCLADAKDRFDASLALEENELVRVQRDLVAVLLGEPADGTPEAIAETRRLSALGEVGVARWRGAGRLLAGPADDVDTWESLLLRSKGEITQWSPTLQFLVEAYQLQIDERSAGMFGNATIDNAKSRLFEVMYESGLLGMLDRYWNVPQWASAAWVLGSRTSAAMREQIGLEIAVSAPVPHTAAVIVPDDSISDTREITARLDRLLALTFLPNGVVEFGDAEDATTLRAWAADFIAAHAGRITYQVDDPPSRFGAEIERRTQQFHRDVAQLPLRLQWRLGRIEKRKWATIARQPVRDFNALEREYLAELDEHDARRLQALLDSRVRATDLLTAAVDRDRAEVRSWFTGRHQVTLDLVQGTELAHWIACHGTETGVTDVGISRAQAQSAASQVGLATTMPDQAEIVRLADGLRATASIETETGVETEVSLRLREPWESVPIENIPDATGRALSQDHAVVRRHTRRPRFGIATARLPRRRVRILGDPMGNTPTKLGLPGSLDEAHGVAEVFGVQAHVQDDATWDRLGECAKEADLLWISTHCEPVSELGGIPALLVRDRWILPSEIGALDVDPGLVVMLTVCAGGRSVPLGAVSGPPLATAFLDAGAALVISPLRRIQDTEWAPQIVDAARACAHRGTIVDLVRTLNAAPAAGPYGGPWVMHA